jgi:hypothetical protein
MNSQDLLPTNEFAPEPAPVEHVTFAIDYGDHFKVASTREPTKVKRVRKPR